MHDYRPDVVFVVTGSVWHEFVRLREDAGDALCLGFLRTCERNIEQAEDANDDERVWHWRAVMSLGCRYGLSFISAVEVDGEIIREKEKFSLWTYPDDCELLRVVIDGRQLDRVTLQSNLFAPVRETIATREIDRSIRVSKTTGSEEVFTEIAVEKIEALDAALLRHLPETPVKFASDTLVLMGNKFKDSTEDHDAYADIGAFLIKEGVPHRNGECP